MRLKVHIANGNTMCHIEREIITYKPEFLPRRNFFTICIYIYIERDGDPTLGPDWPRSGRKTVCVCVQKRSSTCRTSWRRQHRFYRGDNPHSSHVPLAADDTDSADARWLLRLDRLDAAAAAGICCLAPKINVRFLRSNDLLTICSE